MPVKEGLGLFTDIAVIWELRGGYPTDIPYFPDIDIAELTKGDADPMFLTIPIGKANVTSGNNRYYDEAWLQELERQVIANRPIGIMGHLAEEELGTKFPDEAVHWVGVRRVNEMLWAKGYIPPGAARDRVRRYKATNKTLATSIFAKAEGLLDKARGVIHMLAETLNLYQIDIGPADRVGIADLARVPLLTAEMQDTHKAQEPTMADKQVDIIQELGKVQPVKGWQTPKVVQETAPDLAQLTQEMAELRKQNEALTQAAIKTRIRELASDAETGIKIAPVREVVISMVEAAEPQTVDEAEAKYNTIVTSGPITELLKDRVVQTMGPPQRTRVQPQQGANKYFTIPQEAK